MEKANQQSGEYLREYPKGRHTQEAVDRVPVVLNSVMDNLEGVPDILAEFHPTERCGELHAELDPLLAAVNAATAARKPEAARAIDRFARLCR